MAKDREGLIVTLLIINTILLGAMAMKMFGCYSQKGICAVGQKGSGTICPFSKKVDKTNLPTDQVMGQK